MAVREVAMRYRQSWLGMFWVVLMPLAMLAVYTLVFKHIFQVRWSMPNEGELAFALRIYAGLALFTFFAEYANRAPTMVTEQPYLIKKVLFPVEILPWVGLLSALIGLLVATVTLLLLSLFGRGYVPISAVTLWVVWFPLLPFCLGLGWALSAIGTYVRDVSQVVSMVMSALIFVSPVFFPVEALPKAAQDWMWMNPLAIPMTQTRLVLLDGIWPDWSAWSVSMLTGAATALAGAWLFNRLKVGFADVL